MIEAQNSYKRIDNEFHMAKLEWGVEKKKILSKMRETEIELRQLKNGHNSDTGELALRVAKDTMSDALASRRMSRVAVAESQFAGAMALRRGQTPRSIMSSRIP